MNLAATILATLMPLRNVIFGCGEIAEPGAPLRAAIFVLRLPFTATEAPDEGRT
jgi:hypothetical protein